MSVFKRQTRWINTQTDKSIVWAVKLCWFYREYSKARKINKRKKIRKEEIRVITENPEEFIDKTKNLSVPWMEEPGGLQSMGSLGVGHDWVTSLSLFTFLHWRRKWQPTPVFSSGESQGRGSLVGCRLWGHTELDTTEVT